MENNIQSKAVTIPQLVIPSDALLDQWQGHRRLTRKVIESFPEDRLFEYSIGGMRPFAKMAMEMIGLAEGIRGIVTGEWKKVEQLLHHSKTSKPNTKEELLHRWDEVTELIDTLWRQIPPHRFREIVLAFGQFEGPAYGIIFYWIDNEIHHRGQGYVYLRSLGIEPPAFWDRG